MRRLESKGQNNIFPLHSLYLVILKISVEKQEKDFVLINYNLVHYFFFSPDLLQNLHYSNLINVYDVQLRLLLFHHLVLQLFQLFVFHSHL